MKKTEIIVVILVALFTILMFGCDSVKRVERMKAKYCPLCFDSSKVQTITYRDTIIAHDTILQFYESYAEDTVFDNSACDFPIRVIRNTSWTAKIWMTDGKIFCSLHDIKAKVVTHETTKTVTQEVKKYYPVEKIKEVKYIPHAYLVTSWLAWIGGGGYILYMVGKSTNLWYVIGQLLYQIIALFKRKKK